MFGGTSVPLWRRLLAGLGAIASAAVLWSWVPNREKWIVIPAFLALFGSVLSVHIPHLGAQIFARAAWWATVGFGLIVTFVAHGDKIEAFMYLVPSAFSLLVIGPRGIAEAEERAGHMPTAFRSSLLLLMVLALADAQTFGVFGLISVDSHWGSAWLLFLCAAVLVVGFVGLFRLQPWGALLNLGACAFLFVAKLVGLLRGDTSLEMAVLALADVHVVVAAPLVVAAALKKTLPSLPAQMRSVAMHAAIIGIVVVAGLRTFAR